MVVWTLTAADNSQHEFLTQVFTYSVMSSRSSANFKFFIASRLLSASRRNLWSRSSVAFLSASVKGGAPLRNANLLLRVLHSCPFNLKHNKKSWNHAVWGLLSEVNLSLSLSLSLSRNVQKASLTFEWYFPCHAVRFEVRPIPCSDLCFDDRLATSLHRKRFRLSSFLEWLTKTPRCWPSGKIYFYIIIWKNIYRK